MTLPPFPMENSLSSSSLLPSSFPWSDSAFWSLAPPLPCNPDDDLQDDVAADVDNMDIEEFVSIMQEPPDPEKLAGYIDTEQPQPAVPPVSDRAESPEPCYLEIHQSQQWGPVFGSQEQPRPAVAPASDPAESPETYYPETDQDCKMQAWDMQFEESMVFDTRVNKGETAGQAADSSQSDAFSQLSEQSVDADERPRLDDGSLLASDWLGQASIFSNSGEAVQGSTEFTDGTEAARYVEPDRWDLKSYGSGALSQSTTLAKHAEDNLGAKVLVDLTDTDSEGEGEINWNNSGVNGKRKLPSWVEPRQRISADTYTRHPYRKDTITSYNLETKPAQAQDFLGTRAGMSSYNSSSALSLSGSRLEGVSMPGGVNLLDQASISSSSIGGAQVRRGNGYLGAGQGTSSNFIYDRIFPSCASNDSTLKRVLPSTLVPQIGPAKDYSSGHDKETTSRGILKILDEVVFKEESCPSKGLMAVPLLKHQRIALAWMEKKEKGSECAGGILADDQGLGKTISTIALILKAKPPASTNSLSDGFKQVYWEASAVDLDDEEDADSHMGKMVVQKINTNAQEWSHPLDKQHQEKTVVVSRGRPSAGTLVVCPTSVLRQWAQEIKEKVTKAAGLSVLLYHGSNRTKDPTELAKHDVVLTTYSIVSMEVPKQPLPDEKEADERNPAQYGLICSTSTEKKRKTVESGKKKKAKGKKGDSDAVDDSDSGPLARVAWFRVILDEAQNIKNRRTQVARACWGLRAKRRWCLSGTPIQNAIDDLYSYFRFLKYDPFSAYKSFRSEIKDPIARDPTLGYKKLQYVLQKVMLRRTKTTLINGEPIITLPQKTVRLQQVEFSAAERAFYSNLEVQSRKQFQVYAAAGTVQSNYVNILWMLLRLRQACDHPLLVKDHHSDTAQRSSLESLSKLSDEKRTILLTVIERNRDTCSICMDAPEDAVITLCAHVFCRQCISERLNQDDNACCPHPKCHASLSSSVVYSLSALKYPSDGMGAVAEPAADIHTQASLKDTVPETSSKIKAVIETLRALPPLERPSRKADTTKAETSTSGLDNDACGSCNQEETRPCDREEITTCDQEENITEKAIVFSQWTSMLDLLEVSLKKEGFYYRRLDGTMSIQARDRALSDFKLLPEVTVIIMSLKAASLGLNMVAACHVLLIDVWWNPTTEEQAIDRAHRIGQTRDVKVSRYTVKNTIEDRILALQDRKRQMVASAFGEDAGTEQRTRLSVDEMRYLFRA